MDMRKALHELWWASHGYILISKHLRLCTLNMYHIFYLKKKKNITIWKIKEKILFLQAAACEAEGVCVSDFSLAEAKTVISEMWSHPGEEGRDTGFVLSPRKISAAASFHVY